MTPRSLADFAEDIESTPHPDLELINRTVERLRESDPNTADALRYCAIPRRLDAGIIGTLRDAPEETTENARILAAVAGHSFVLPRTGGGYVYHDNVRDVLLGWWRRPENRELFDTLNARMVGGCQREQSEVQRFELALSRVGEVIRTASPTRYRQVTARLEQRILTPLLDALYHETLRSAEKGFTLMNDQFFEWERAGRTRICAALVAAETEYIERLHPSEEHASEMKWLRYFDARVKLSEGEYSEVEALLRSLADETQENKLRLWVLGDLGQCLHSQSRLREALATYTELLDLAQRTSADTWNIAAWQSLIAAIYWSFDELIRAEEHFRIALETARSIQNHSSVVNSLADLAAILQSRGRFDEALDCACEALDVAHTQIRIVDRTYTKVLNTLGSLSARRSPELLETLMAEIRAVQPGGAEPVAHARTLIQIADLLKEGFQFPRAQSTLDEAARSWGTPAEGIVTEWLLTRADLRSVMGVEREAVSIYAQVVGRVDSGWVTFWQHAALQHNRAESQLEIGDLEEALAGFVRAEELWSAMGHRHLKAFARFGQARVLRCRGEIASAVGIVDAVIEELRRGGSCYVAPCFKERGRLYTDVGLYPLAISAYEQSLELRLSTGDWRGAALVLGELAAAASASLDSGAAARYAGRAAEFHSRVADLLRFACPPRHSSADEENVRGVALLRDAGPERHENTVRAHEFFCSASNLNPENFWYHLNAAYASAELFNWTTATDHMQTAVRLAPEWWNTGRFVTRLVSYRSEYFKAAEAAHADDPASPRARREYLQALEVLSETAEPDPAAVARLNARLSYIHLQSGDSIGAAERWKASEQHYTAAGLPRTSAAIAGVWKEMIQSTEHFWRAYDAVGELCASDPERIRPARDVLCTYLDEALDPVATSGVESADRLIRLDIGPGLVAEETGTDKWSLFTTYIPTMRAHVREVTGFRIPGIRVMESGTGGDYGISLEAFVPPQKVGSVPLHYRFALASPDFLLAAGVDANSLQAAHDPLTGRPGAWVAPSQWERVMQAGVELLEESLVYIVRHLESMALRHLDQCVTFEDALDLVEEWARDVELRPLVDKVRASDANLCLAGLLRAMARDQVPVVDARLILSTFCDSDMNPAALPAILFELRLAHASILPGCEPHTPRVDSAPALDALCADLLAGEREFSQAAMETIACTLDGLATLDHDSRSWPRVAVVATHSEIAAVLRVVAAARVPSITVISRAESARSPFVAPDRAQSRSG